MAASNPRQSPSPPLHSGDGIASDRWYDSTDFCRRLGVAEHPRRALLSRLRRCDSAIPNGHSYIAEGRVLLGLLASANGRDGFFQDSENSSQ